MHGTTNMIFVPDKNIEFVCASSNNQIIGRALFCNFSDEVNFDARSANVERQKARLKQIISQVDARMASRFLRGDFLPTLNIIADSIAFVKKMEKLVISYGSVRSTTVSQVLL